MSYSIGVVTGNDEVGGLVGYNYGNINSSYSIGTINGRYYVGGLVGWNWNGNITTSYSNCSVSGGDYIGGLVGFNGGLLGRMLGDERDGTVTQCYSSGKVNGTRSVGGLVGVIGMFSVVDNSFWDIEASGKTTSDGGIGLTTVQMQSVDTFLEWGSCGNEAVWTIDDGKDYPRLSWENKSGKPIESKLSDFLAGEGTQASPYLVYTLQDINLISRFPCEQDKHFRLMFLAGEGTQENPYLISTADELHMLGRCLFNLDMHFRLMADISLLDFDGKDGRPAFRSIGTYGNGFTGIFNGNGHTISHLTIADRDYNTGLFSRLASGGEILDLGVVDVNIETSTYWHDYYGGLVGVNSGIVVSCYSTGSIAVDSYYVGGLVGLNSGTVIQCYSTGTVSGNDNVGGLVGINAGMITSSYNSCAVSGNDSVGGLVGWNWGGIAMSYSTGSVSGASGIGGLLGTNAKWAWQCLSTARVSGSSSVHVGGLIGSNHNFYQTRVVDCFWDIQTSGQATSDGGIGKTTAEMQTASTFLEAGWDFVVETVNGPNDIWWILEGQDYPRLWWELISEN